MLGAKARPRPDRGSRFSGRYAACNVDLPEPLKAWVPRTATRPEDDKVWISAFHRRKPVPSITFWIPAFAGKTRVKKAPPIVIPGEPLARPGTQKIIKRLGSG